MANLIPRITVLKSRIIPGLAKHVTCNTWVCYTVFGLWRHLHTWRPRQRPSQEFMKTIDSVATVFPICFCSKPPILKPCLTLKLVFLTSYVLSLLLQSSSGITWAPRLIPTLGASKKSWLFLFERWEGNALLWASRWNYKSPWQPCNRWIMNVIQMLFYLEETINRRRGKMNTPGKGAD